jgi:hypothetical protein
MKTAWLAWLPECGLGPGDGQDLGLVHHLATAVIALARIALGVLVRQDRPLRLEHGAGNDVLRGDQLDLVLLAPEFTRDHRTEGGVGLRD